MTGVQARMARVALRLTVADVARMAEVAPNTILRVEAGKSVNTSTVKALRAAYEDAGVRFTGDECVCAPPGSGALVLEEGREPRAVKNRPKGTGDVAAAFAAFALLLPFAAGATPAVRAEPPQACLSPAEMAALLPASREQAEDFCEDGDARALERVRAVLRLLGRHLDRGASAPDAAAD